MHRNGLPHHSLESHWIVVASFSFLRETSQLLSHLHSLWQHSAPQTSWYKPGGGRFSKGTGQVVSWWLTGKSRRGRSPVIFLFRSSVLVNWWLDDLLSAVQQFVYNLLWLKWKQIHTYEIKSIFFFLLEKLTWSWLIAFLSTKRCDMRQWKYGNVKF